EGVEQPVILGPECLLRERFRFAAAAAEVAAEVFRAVQLGERGRRGLNGEEPDATGTAADGGESALAKRVRHAEWYQARAAAYPAALEGHDLERSARVVRAGPGSAHPEAPVAIASARSAAFHVGASDPAIGAPPSTRSPSYSTASWPGVTAACGVSNRSSTRPFSSGWTVT